MNRILVASTLCVYLFNANSQILQTYNGVFENGKAIYQYYENEKADRIYEGSFNYTSKIYTILGQFKANKRDGIWKTSALNKTFVSEIGKININTSINGAYSNGNMEGLWTISNTIKTFNPKTKKANPKPEKVIASATFKDNHFVGKFTFEKTITSKTTMDGQFNEMGFADGIWSVKTEKTIEEIKYKNGFEYSRFSKDITTGEKIVSYDSSAFYELFWKAYNKTTGLAQMNGKMYFLDTVELNHQALAIWKADLYVVEKFGNIVNPLYYYKKGQNTPHSYEIKIISCDNDVDCYTNYMKNKNAELERIKAQQNAEAERLRLEAIEKEEKARLEKEKELERQRLENIANIVKSGDNLMTQKRYKEAIQMYANANQLQFSNEVDLKILESQKKIRQIDSLHTLKNALYNEIKSNSDVAFAKTNSLELPLKNKKKSFAKNYVMTMDYLKSNFNIQMDAYNKLNENYNPNLDVWSEIDQNSLTLLKDLQIQTKEITDFQNAIADATMNDNKDKLRVLNSSINPKVIVHDILHFKEMK